MTTSTKDNIESRVYRQRLGKQEERVVGIAEEYTPSTAGDWTTVPTKQDQALDLLAAEASGVAVKTVKAVYDFATDGGTQGDIALSVTLPDDAIVMQVTQDVVVSPDSAGDTGTIKLKLPTDGDLTANIIADAGTSGVADGVPDNTAANSVKTTAARTLTVEIGTEDLTAGKIVFFVSYLRSE